MSNFGSHLKLRPELEPGPGEGGVHENATRHFFFASLSSDFIVLGSKNSFLKAKASLKTHYFIFENQLIHY